jgi:hypothetical protein
MKRLLKRFTARRVATFLAVSLGTIALSACSFSWLAPIGSNLRAVPSASEFGGLNESFSVRRRIQGRSPQRLEPSDEHRSQTIGLA